MNDPGLFALEADPHLYLSVSKNGVGGGRYTYSDLYGSY